MPRKPKACAKTRCSRKHLKDGLCAMHYWRRERAVQDVVEKRTFPYDPLRLPRNRASSTMHVPACVLDSRGKWHDVAACSNKIPLGARKVWREPRSGPKPVLCGACVALMQKHGLI